MDLPHTGSIPGTISSSLISEKEDAENARLNSEGGGITNWSLTSCP